MRKFVCFLLISILLTAAIFPLAVNAEGELKEEDLCFVHVRFIWHKDYPDVSSIRYEYATFYDAEHTKMYQWISGKATQGRKWEVIILAPKGGYCMIWDAAPYNEVGTFTRSEEREFEVKGDEMYVYIGMAPTGYDFRTPDPWIVYGKETRSFSLWPIENAVEESKTELSETEGDESGYYDDVFSNISDESEASVDESEESSRITSDSIVVGGESNVSVSGEAEEDSKPDIPKIVVSAILIICVVAVIGILIKRKEK